MKTTLITTFSIAVMAFAFNAGSAQAIGDTATCYDEYTCNKNKNVASVDEIRDLDQTEADNERDVADSGNEGSTSAASTNDQ